MLSGPEADLVRTCIVNYVARWSPSTDPVRLLQRCGIMQRVLDGVALAEDGHRNNTVNQAASIIAYIVPDYTPVEAALAVVHPSLSQMYCGPEGFESLAYWCDHFCGRLRARLEALRHRPGRPA